MLTVIDVPEKIRASPPCQNAFVFQFRPAAAK